MSVPRFKHGTSGKRSRFVSHSVATFYQFCSTLDVNIRRSNRLVISVHFHNSTKKGHPLRTISGAWRERRYSSYTYLTSALEGGEWSASRPGRALPPGKEPPGTHCTGGWVGPTAGMDAGVRGKILCLCRGSNPGRPVRSQSLY
jgi:hypothetical protein